MTPSSPLNEPLARGFGELKPGDKFVFPDNDGTVYEKKDANSFFPVGGGFEYTLEAASKTVDSGVLPPPPAELVPDKFYFADDPDGALVLDGYHNPRDRWNGWCKPLFEEAEIRRFIEWEREVIGALSADSSSHFLVEPVSPESEVSKVLVRVNTEEPHIIAFAELQVWVNNAPKWVWPLPDFTWSCMAESLEMEESDGLS